MDADPNMTPDLGDIRREIDEIDGQLLELLQARFEASERVRIAKSAYGDGGGSTMRPAREAALLRNLIAVRRDPLPLDVIISIWRSILAGSTLLQAAASVNLPSAVAGNSELRTMLGGHFASLPVVVHDDDAQVLSAVAADPAALAVLRPEGNWPRQLGSYADGTLSVTGTLPFMARNPNPDIVVISHAPSAATGQDETLILSSGQLPRDFVPAPMWRLKLDDGDWLTSLPGYLSLSELPLVSLTHGNDELALQVLGRYPSPLSID